MLVPLSDQGDMAKDNFVFHRGVKSGVGYWVMRFTSLNWQRTGERANGKPLARSSGNDTTNSNRQLRLVGKMVGIIPLLLL